MSNKTLSGVYEYALRHLVAERNEIEVRIQFIRQQLGDGAQPVGLLQGESAGRAPRKFSAEARARMKAGQARRWAAKAVIKR